MLGVVRLWVGRECGRSLRCGRELDQQFADGIVRLNKQGRVQMFRNAALEMCVTGMPFAVADPCSFG